MDSQLLQFLKELERQIKDAMNITESFKNKTLVITGGTGSFATA